MLARNFLEMVAAMWVGMALGGLIFVPILDALGMTASEATPQSDPPSLRPPLGNSHSLPAARSKDTRSTAESQYVHPSPPLVRATC